VAEALRGLGGADSERAGQTRARTPPAERSRTPPSERWRSGMRRAGARRQTLKKDASAAVTIASLSDLFSLERHAAVPASMRGEQLQRLVLHYIIHLSEWSDSSMPEPPFVRLGHDVELPSVEEVEEAAAEEGEPDGDRWLQVATGGDRWRLVATGGDWWRG